MLFKTFNRPFFVALSVFSFCCLLPMDNQEKAGEKDSFSLLFKEAIKNECKSVVNHRYGFFKEGYLNIGKKVYDISSGLGKLSYEVVSPFSWLYTICKKPIPFFIAIPKSFCNNHSHKVNIQRFSDSFEYYAPAAKWSLCASFVSFLMNLPFSPINIAYKSKKKEEMLANISLLMKEHSTMNEYLQQQQ